jgi:hypothetical protein
MHISIEDPDSEADPVPERPASDQDPVSNKKIRIRPDPDP